MLPRGVRIQATRSVRAMSSSAAADPAFTRTYGGLKDQDRIFTNLYGEGVSIFAFISRSMAQHSYSRPLDDRHAEESAFLYLCNYLSLNTSN